jgi:hypothetical protein
MGVAQAQTLLSILPGVSLFLSPTGENLARPLVLDKSQDNLRLKPLSLSYANSRIVLEPTENSHSASHL